MKFTITHPMYRHPYNPELVRGAGITTVAAAAEIHGFGFTDHPAPTQRWLEAGGHDALDPFVALGFAAAGTTTLRLIPNVVVLPYRNPFVVAKSGATLDVLSEGRFTLAVGVGYLEGEFAALGVDFEERAALFDESLDVIRAIWSGDDVTFEGKHFSASGVTVHPRPVSEPHPPIWIGGNTGAARRRVADKGDGCRRLDRAGRDPSTIDVVFGNVAGGSPADDDFNADAYLAGLDRLATLGVTWVQVGLPGDSLAHALEVIDRFRNLVVEVR